MMIYLTDCDDDDPNITPTKRRKVQHNSETDINKEHEAIVLLHKNCPDIGNLESFKVLLKSQFITCSKTINQCRWDPRLK